MYARSLIDELGAARGLLRRRRSLQVVAVQLLLLSMESQRPAHSRMNVNGNVVQRARTRARVMPAFDWMRADLRAKTLAAAAAATQRRPIPAERQVRIRQKFLLCLLRKRLRSAALRKQVCRRRRENAPTECDEREKLSVGQMDHGQRRAAP